MAKKTDLNKETISPDLVAYSRVGDTFHYRWAARRCLHLLDFNSDLEYITIEGSKEPRLAGEYVIDTAEYRIGSNNKKSEEYFQLKHSTTQCDKDFTLSDLKTTIEGFANRFRDIQKKKTDFVSIKFTIITNRPISQNFKNSIINISEGKSGGKVFDKTIRTYTRHSEKQLKIFCKYLKLSDGEGDYDAQKYQLHKELSQLTAETNDVRHLLNLVELIRSRIEPKTVRKDIKREDVLEQLGFTSICDLFPAPPEFECLAKVIHREQNNQIYQSIINSQLIFIQLI